MSGTGPDPGTAAGNARADAASGVVPIEWSVDVPLGRVTGLRAGTVGGVPVLALHGWLDNAASFLPLTPHMHAAAPAPLDLVLLDLPGHGHSAHLPMGAEYGMAQAVASVLDVADALGWATFNLLGHSMGAGIASLLAAVAPTRVRRLVAIEALGGLAEAEDRTASRWRDSLAAARAVPAKQRRVFPDLSAPIRARMLANQLSEPSARLLVTRGVEPVPDGYRWNTDPRLTLPTAIRLTNPQVDDLVAAIECPTRVIYADPPQPYFPEPLRSARAGLLRDGQLVVLQGGHHLHMEDPALVSNAIGGWFS